MQIKTSTKKLITASILASTLLLSQSANAGLIARTITDATFGAVDAYYDDVLDITWLKDANFSYTSHYRYSAGNYGVMNWATANTWAGQLQIGAFDDWRLPSIQPRNGSTFDYRSGADGSGVFGYNITSPLNEIAYMFHVNLGLDGQCDGVNNMADYCDTSGTGFHNIPYYRVIDTANLGNKIAIDNLMSGMYWNDIEFELLTNNAWAFNSYIGYQQHYSKNSGYFYGWAVRSGDVIASTSPVTSVPEPTTLAIFGLGLLGLVARHKSA